MSVRRPGIVSILVAAAIALSGGTTVLAQGTPPTPQQEIKSAGEPTPPRRQTDAGDETQKQKANTAGGSVVVDGLATVPVDIMVDD
jgi:hypothetical protein